MYCVGEETHITWCWMYMCIVRIKMSLVVLEGGTAEAARTAVTLAGSVREVWHAIERILTDH